jgi:hypothetical protein
LKHPAIRRAKGASRRFRFREVVAPKFLLEIFHAGLPKKAVQIPT